MFATAHTFAGVTIATLVSNPWLALPLSLISHVVLDLTPHWDFFSFKDEITTKVKLRVIADFLLGLSVGILFVLKAFPNRGQAATIFFSCILANLPDTAKIPHIFFNKDYKLTSKIIDIERILHSRASFPWGLITQIAFIDLCLVLLSL